MGAIRGQVAQVCTALLLCAAAGVSRLHAQAPHNVAEQYLFNAANAERQARGLPALRWDDTLYRAAWSHAREMAARESISHQYEGEADLAERAQETGARFSEVAENVAEAPTAVLIHRGWMESPHHRENLLDPNLDRVAISVWSRNGQLYAVQDFDRGVVVLSFLQQEDVVAGLLAGVVPLNIRTASEQARATCGQESGYAGTRRPWFVMRFTASALDQLPRELTERLASGKYREAQVGACPLHSTHGFSGYNIAVLLFP